MRLLTWNLQWKRPESFRGQIIKKCIEGIDPDIAVLTETDGEFFPREKTVSGRQNWGYDSRKSRHKVQIWSRNGWSEIDDLGSARLPGGRYVSGITEIDGRAIRCIGVCIPWRNAHVTSGRKDRAQWEDHIAFLEGLKGILDNVANSCILAGDWNQRIPPKYQPERIHSVLRDSIPEAFTILTSGIIPNIQDQVIDHVAATTDLVPSSVSGVSRLHSQAGQLTDHYGVTLDFLEDE